jgi:hypothetical protein
VDTTSGVFPQALLSAWSVSNGGGAALTNPHSTRMYRTYQTVNAVCKDVRREIRKITDGERERYLQVGGRADQQWDAAGSTTDEDAFKTHWSLQPPL